MKCLPMVQYAINDSVHASTGYSPFELVYGERPFSGLDHYLSAALGMDHLHPQSTRFVLKWKAMVDSARKKILRSQIDAAKHYNKSRRDVSFTVGAKVLLSSRSLTAPTHRDTKWKLRPTYYGPFSIEDVLRAEDGMPAAYRLRLPLHWKVHSVFPVSRLREYYPGLEWPGRDMGTPPESQWPEGG